MGGSTVHHLGGSNTWEVLLYTTLEAVTLGRFNVPPWREEHFLSPGGSIIMKSPSFAASDAKDSSAAPQGIADEAEHVEEVQGEEAAHDEAPSAEN